MSDEFTVGDLRRQLEGIPDDHILHFDGGVTFSRLKRWGDTEWVLLFGELQADLMEGFRQENPDILVAFMKRDDPE